MKSSLQSSAFPHCGFPSGNSDQVACRDTPGLYTHSDVAGTSMMSIQQTLTSTSMRRQHCVLEMETLEVREVDQTSYPLDSSFAAPGQVECPSCPCMEDLSVVAESCSQHSKIAAHENKWFAQCFWTTLCSKGIHTHAHAKRHPCELTHRDTQQAQRHRHLQSDMPDGHAPLPLPPAYCVSPCKHWEGERKAGHRIDSQGELD